MRRLGDLGIQYEYCSVLIIKELGRSPQQASSFFARLGDDVPHSPVPVSHKIVPARIINSRFWLELTMSCWLELSLELYEYEAGIL